MNTLNVSFPLGRLALSHEARIGMHLIQDPDSRHWLVVPADRPRTLFQRFRCRLGSMARVIRGSRFGPLVWLAAAVSFGLVAAVSFNQLSRPGSKTALGQQVSTVPLAPAPAQPNSISLNGAPYTEQTSIQSNQAQTVPLPLPLNTSLPLPSPRETAQAPKVAAKPIADDSPMAVFNEPLQLAKPAQQLTMPPMAKTGQELVSQGSSNNGKPIGAAKVRMLAVQSPTSIVVTNPQNRLPMTVKVGDSLPDGSVLKSIDKTNATAVSSRGETLVLQ